MPTHEWVFINVVPYKNLHFGLTSYNTRDDAKADMGTISVWETVDGKWSWIFDYTLPTQFHPGKGTLEQQVAAERERRDRLYAQHRLSPDMRRKLEKKLKEETAPRGPDEPAWRYYW